MFKSYIRKYVVRLVLQFRVFKLKINGFIEQKLRKLMFIKSIRYLVIGALNIFGTVGYSLHCLRLNPGLNEPIGLSIVFIHRCKRPKSTSNLLLYCILTAKEPARPCPANQHIDIFQPLVLWPHFCKEHFLTAAASAVITNSIYAYNIVTSHTGQKNTRFQLCPGESTERRENKSHGYRARTTPFTRSSPDTYFIVVRRATRASIIAAYMILYNICLCRCCYYCIIIIRREKVWNPCYSYRGSHR